MKKLTENILFYRFLCEVLFLIDFVLIHGKKSKGQKIVETNEVFIKYKINENRTIIELRIFAKDIRNISK